VSSKEACYETLAALQIDLQRSIVGIVHGAGRADAAPLMQQTTDLMRRTPILTTMMIMKPIVMTSKLRAHLENLPLPMMIIMTIMMKTL
jgi:hypothetical protein